MLQNQGKKGQVGAGFTNSDTVFQPLAENNSQGIAFCKDKQQDEVGNDRSQGREKSMEGVHLEWQKPYSKCSPALTALGCHSTNRSKFSLTVKCHYLVCPASGGNISCVSSRGKGLTKPERNAGCSGTGDGDGETKPRGTRAARATPGFARGSGGVCLTAPRVETWD